MSIDVLARAWKHSQQDSSRLLALLALASMAHDDGVLWMRGVTVEYIGKKARTKPRQTQSNLRALEQAGEIYAPPAVGRGNTTRYFVTVGLSEAEISATLRLEYELPIAQARKIAAGIVSKQKVQPAAPFIDAPVAPEEDGSPGKVQPTAPIKKVQPTAPITEKVQSSVIKGAIQRHENDGFGASGSAIPDPIHGDHDHDSSSSSGDRKFLRDSGFYNGTIRQILDLRIDSATLRASVTALLAAGWGAGAIANELRDNPPQRGIPYDKPQSGLREQPAPPRPERHAAAPFNRARASRQASSHQPTGGAELRDPGWMDREIARAEAIARGEL